MNRPLPLACLLAAALSFAAPAQQVKVLPPGFDQIEGNLTHTYPFGRQTGGLQWIVDPIWITPQQGLILGVRYRADGGNFNTTFAGYSKAYQLTVATTTLPASSMTTDPLTNHGGATPITAFSAVLNVPSSNAQPTSPRPFALHMPFSAPYVYDGTQGSLILTLTTADASTPPGRWSLDACNLKSTSGEGIVEAIAEGCTNAQGAGLTLDVDNALFTWGGTLLADLTTNAPGAFPNAVLLVGFTRPDFDLSVIGMPNCLLVAGDAFGVALTDSGSGYPQFNLPIPNVPAMEGAVLFAQAAGIAQFGTFQNAVVSNGLGMRVGSATGASQDGMSIFSSNLTSWYIGRSGTYMPIIQLDGVFP